MHAHEQDTRRLRRAFQGMLAFVVMLWAIKAVEALSGQEFVSFGIYPLTARGLTGVLLAPLIHGSWSHLASNSLPVLILGTALFYGYPRSAGIVAVAVWLGAGLGVWLFARGAYHIGASGLTFGAMFFLFVIGILRWDKRAIVLASIVFFLYGSMIWGIFPVQPGISFETHFFGAAIGVLLAFVLRHVDPAPPEKRYSWEDEPDEDPSADWEADAPDSDEEPRS